MNVPTVAGHPGDGGARRAGETGAYKWFVAAVLGLAHTVAVIDRFVMVLVAEPIRARMHLSDTQLGLLQGTGFAILYCAFAVPLGCIADATNRRNLILAGLWLWSLATVAAAFTTSFETLFATRVLVGMGEACLIPAGMSLLAAYFAPTTLARGTAIFGLGANFGYGLAFLGGGALLSVLIARGGLDVAGVRFAPWQGIFVAAAAMAVPVLVLLLWLRELPRVSGTDTASTPFAMLRDGLAFIRSNLRILCGGIAGWQHDGGDGLCGDELVVEPVRPDAWPQRGGGREADRADRHRCRANWHDRRRHRP